MNSKTPTELVRENGWASAELGSRAVTVCACSVRTAVRCVKLLQTQIWVGSQTNTRKGSVMQESFEFTFKGTTEEFLKKLQADFEKELAKYFEEGSSLDRLIPFEGRHYWISGRPEAERGINGGLYRIKYQATSQPIEYETIKDPNPIILDDGTLYFLDRPANREDFGRSEPGIVFDLATIALGGSEEITKVRVSLGHEAFGIKPDDVMNLFQVPNKSEVSTGPAASVSVQSPENVNERASINPVIIKAGYNSAHNWARQAVKDLIETSNELSDDELEKRGLEIRAKWQDKYHRTQKEQFNPDYNTSSEHIGENFRKSVVSKVFPKNWKDSEDSEELGRLRKFLVFPPGNRHN